MIWRVVLVIFLIFMFLGSSLKESEITQEQMDNATERMSYDNLNLSIEFQEMGNNNNNTFLVRSIGKVADLYGFLAVEGARTSMDFGYDNPQYNYDLAWRLLLVTIFAFLIVPLIKVGLFIGYGIYGIVIWIRKKWGDLK